MSDDIICSTCSGSGEGMWDGTRCSSCKGAGVERDGEDALENAIAKADYENDQRMMREMDREWESRK